MHQFLVVLVGTDPLVWRRVQVPQEYTFWDLHVAIQDAMGWHDSHLHEFRLLDAASGTLLSIGIPTGEESRDRPVLPGWRVPLSRFFERRGWHAPPAVYAYDFGDDWEHVLVHEGLLPVERKTTYPRLRGQTLSAGRLRRSPPVRGDAAGHRQSQPPRARVVRRVDWRGLRP